VQDRAFICRKKKTALKKKKRSQSCAAIVTSCPSDATSGETSGDDRPGLILGDSSGSYLPLFYNKAIAYVLKEVLNNG